MKKVKYFLLALLVVVSFSGMWSSLNAQIYSHPVHRTKFMFNGDGGLGISTSAGGTATIDWKISRINVSSRGVSLLDKDVLSVADYDQKYYPAGKGGGQINLGYLADSYFKIDDEIEVVAGQEVSINCEGTAAWANAALYVDWDGNGVFDDHELLENNLYRESCNFQEEYSNVLPDGFSDKMNPSWTINIPKTYTEKRVVRCRIKTDEGVKHYVERRGQEIYTRGIPGCSTMGQANQDGTLDGTTQYFFSMVLHRFMPSASLYRGITLDFDLTVVPDEFLNQTIESESLVSEVGSVTCETTSGTPISDEAGFEAFLAASSGNYYLSQDITISSTLDVSQTTFSGTFDGNGHTITINPTTATKAFNATSKDALFYPYGDNQDSGLANKIRENILTYNWGEGTVATDPFPAKTIGGGFCGVLDFGGVIKNVKVVYAKNCTYQGGKASLFGLVAGVAKGKVENVSVSIEGGATVKVESNGTTVGACGGITGVLYRGILKNCEVNVDGTLNFGKNSGTLPRESALGGLVGRLQAGVVGNVKFGGTGTLALAATNNVNYSRFYIGGVAGMTNNPQGAFCSNFQYEWGYDNGTVGLDVNNVILNFSGNMDMGSDKGSATHNYYCRGLLFAEATDTVTVPNLITQYASLPTIESAANANQTITGLAIPLISTTAGHAGSLYGNLSDADVLSSVGKLYLYKDGRIPANASLSAKFTNVTTADTELNWAYEVQNITTDGNTACVSFSTPYAVATYTGTNANIQGIEGASANVSDLGSAVVKIDPQPADVADPTWTWSETATPVTPDTDAPICSGGGEIIYPMADAACTPTENSTHAGRRLDSFTIGDNNGNTATATDIQPTIKSAVYVDKTTSVLTSTAGATLSFTALNWIGEWMHAYVYIDYNNNGTFDQVLNADGGNSGELVSYNFYSAGGTPDGQNSKGQAMSSNCDVLQNNMPSWTLPADLPNGIYRLRFKVDWNHLNPCGNTIVSNGGCICDITLNIGGVTPNATATTYCAQPTFSSDGQTPPATGYLQNLTANGTALATNWSYDKEKNVTGNTITINQGESLTLDFQFNSQHTDKMQYTTALAFVDLNGDGFFTENERIYAKGGVGWESSAIGYESLLVDGISNDKPWTSTKTVNFAPTATSSLLRIFTVSEWGINCENKSGSKSISTSACANGGDINGDEGANKFHCYDFPIVINSAAGGDGCAYVANFGDVYVGDVATYDISLGAGFTALTDADGADEYELDYDNTTGKLTVTYNVPVTPGAVAVDSIGGITKDGDVYRIAVSATVKPAPTVTFRIGENGGGLLSLDMGKTTSYLPYEIDPYKGQLLTAIPIGPTHIEGWYVSTDGGTTFNAVGHANPDYTYTGADDAIVEVRFDFDDFEGNFGDTRFTDATNPPYIINSITTTGGIINVNVTDIFTGGGGEAETAVRAENMSCTNSTNMNRAGHINQTRYVNTITATTASCNFTSSALQTSLTDAVYKDRRTETISVKRGETLSITANSPDGWNGNWMYGYVYIDWNNDGTFNETNELVAQSTDGAVGLSTMPSISIPADAELGTYTLRYKVDWDNTNPCGGDEISGNAGLIADFELHVAASGGVATTSRPHMRYLSNQRLQTLPSALGAMTHTVTVTMENMTTFPSDARLLCFIDYNYNNYFDFTSSPDGLASSLTPNGELIFVGKSNGNAEQTFTFTFNNANITDYGKTRMRFLAATYVDMYGLGPVNQYGNYQPRFDSDGDGIADTYLPLNDNNGDVYTPNNQCNYTNYVNVADVNFEVVAYIRAYDKYVIRNGESIRLGDLYIESVEDASGLKSGQITFDKTAPYGSLSIEGNIIVRKRIYQDRWHDIAFPITMQGTAGDQGICAVAANSSLQKLPDDRWLLKQFNPTNRNNDGGYGKGLYDANKDSLSANTFYEFAADNVDGANLGALDGTNYYWIQFHSLKKGFVITPKKALTHTITYQRDQTSSEYNNRNVFTLYNPYLAPINVQEITTSTDVGWENITWWNASQNRFVGVSASENREMPPYYGYWVQFTEGLGTTSDGDEIDVILGADARDNYAVADHVTFAAKLGKAPTASAFDTPDSYTLGIDAADNASNEYATSSTIVTLTDAGSIDNFRAGYDMPASFATASATVPEIWSLAGSSRMMFNDVQRADEVTVPVGIRIKESGEYALRLTHTNDTTSLVQLYDKATGATVDLQNDGETTPYLFLADEGDSDRFNLVISKAPTAITELEFVETLEQENGEAQVFVSGETLLLKNISLDYSVSVCDVVGREYMRSPITDSEMALQLPVMRGVYMVNILDSQNNLVQSVKVTK